MFLSLFSFFSFFSFFLFSDLSIFGEFTRHMGAEMYAGSRCLRPCMV